MSGEWRGWKMILASILVRFGSRGENGVGKAAAKLASVIIGFMEWVS
jgi:hypothetical protein